MTSFAAMLKSLRKRKDLTQEQVSEYLNISHQAVSRWETGATLPDITVLPQLSELFGVTVDELLGVNEREKQREINSIILSAEIGIDSKDIESAIDELRCALNKYPNNDRLLCSLMYALYTATEEASSLGKYDAEIIAIADRIEKYSTDNDCRSEARSWLFRHYCNTGRKTEALLLADQMPGIETSLERNIYHALEGEDRLSFLTERIFDDMRCVVWDVSAYLKYADIDDASRSRLQNATMEAQKAINEVLG